MPAWCTDDLRYNCVLAVTVGGAGALLRRGGQRRERTSACVGGAVVFFYFFSIKNYTQPFVSLGHPGSPRW